MGKLNGELISKFLNYHLDETDPFSCGLHCKHILVWGLYRFSVR